MKSFEAWLRRQITNFNETRIYQVKLESHSEWISQDELVRKNLDRCFNLNNLGGKNYENSERINGRICKSSRTEIYSISTVHG